MAHRRDDRRINYFKAVGEYFDAAPPRKAKKFKVQVSESGLDEVLYDPRRLVCAPPLDDDPAVRIDEGLLDDVRSAVDRRLAEIGGETSVEDQTHPPTAGPAKPEEGFDPRILDEPAEGGDWREPRVPVGLTKHQRLVFDLPIGIDSAALAEELEATWPDQCTPISYALFQQTAQPGEDPESGRPVFGLSPRDGGPSSANRTLGSGVTVAVIDTGIDEGAVNGASLQQHYRNEFDRRRDLDRLKDPTDEKLLGPAAGHGTFIAGLIHCVAPGAQVRSYLVADTLGFCDEEVIAAGIRRAVDDFQQDSLEEGGDKALVINLSLGGYPFAGRPGMPELRKFAVLQAALAEVPGNVAVVAAAGNCGSADRFYPAAFSTADVGFDVIGVAALDDCHHQLWHHSNYGEWVLACASGVNLRSLFVKGNENPRYDPDKRSETWEEPVNFATWSGTSFAAPLVAAQIAILAAELGIPWSEDNIMIDTREAGRKLLRMSKDHPDPRACGKRILVDLPGQT